MKILDKRFRWRTPAYDRIESVCRVKAYTTELGLVFILADVHENQGPRVMQGLASLVETLSTSSEIQKLPGFESFDSGMWWIAQDAVNPIFMRIREVEGEFAVDGSDTLPAEALEPMLDGIKARAIFDE